MSAAAELAESTTDFAKSVGKMRASLLGFAATVRRIESPALADANPQLWAALRRAAGSSVVAAEALLIVTVSTLDVADLAEEADRAIGGGDDRR